MTESSSGQEPFPLTERLFCAIDRTLGCVVAAVEAVSEAQAEQRLALVRGWLSIEPGRVLDLEEVGRQALAAPTFLCAFFDTSAAVPTGKSAVTSGTLLH